jgi:hypothetical protein
MTTHTVGTALRLLGPTVQVGCLIGLFAITPGPAAGPAAEGRRLLLYAGFGGGLVLVLIGNLLTRVGARPRPAGGRSLDLRLGMPTPGVPPSTTEREPGSREIR